ncbi:MAG: phage antirepressor [Bacilli bacterium]
MSESGIVEFVFEDTRVRVVMIDGQPWFVAKDATDILALGNITEALKRLDEDEFSSTEVVDSIGRKQQTQIVNEAGLYVLILGSRKPQAKTFRRWITHDVLPSIRQTGSYALPQAPQPQLPSSFLEALEMLVVQVKETIRLEGVVDELAPKAEGFDVFLDGQNAKPIGEVAKVVGWGRTRMFRWLREKHILMTTNIPYQEHIESGYFRVREVAKVHGDSVVNHPQTLVTPKGMQWLLKKLQADEILVH